MDPTGNTVLVAGATSGIGLGLALRLHAAGNRVIISGRREDRLKQIVAEHPGIESVVLDEVMSILGAGDQPDEILVKAVEPVRFAEARGEYGAMLRMLSGR
ncbi:SDR family NAD(P)-dependent oxidoreductase [Streptomyces sp. NPDC013161]|uniref:SDR family NAD(P)-dependent oxidoreductase n=1 Tax=Streptomyces sp. NPDC013161 TaxID=3364862 RepID=UPI0036B7AB09